MLLTQFCLLWARILPLLCRIYLGHRWLGESLTARTPWLLLHWSRGPSISHLTYCDSFLTSLSAFTIACPIPWSVFFNTAVRKILLKPKWHRTLLSIKCSSALHFIQCEKTKSLNILKTLELMFLESSVVICVSVADSPGLLAIPGHTRYDPMSGPLHQAVPFALNAYHLHHLPGLLSLSLYVSVHISIH